MEQNQNPTTSAPNGAKASNGMATASLVCGIISIVLCYFWYIGLLCGVLAIIFSILGKNKIKKNPSVNYGGKGAATAGLVLGIIGLILVGIIIYFVVLVAKAITENSAEFNNALQQLQQSLDTMKVK